MLLKSEQFYCLILLLYHLLY